MSHNLHGDVPAKHLELANDLLEMESHFNNNKNLYLPSEIAKVFTCCSHDWYDLGDDEKGSELLLKAEKACPGYFEKQINKDMEEDPDFAYLVESLKEKILAFARSVLG